LRAFLFSPSERYSTFLAKEDFKQKKVAEEEKKTQKGGSDARRDTSDFKNEKKYSKGNKDDVKSKKAESV
jgi:hypothetical protein